MTDDHLSTPGLWRGLRISLVTAVVLLGVGALAGYALRLPATQPAPSLTEITDEVATVMMPAAYDWVSQDRTAGGARAWGLFAADQIGESIYLLVFTNVDSPQDRMLWRSSDGLSWTKMSLDFGPDTTIHDLDAYEGSLLLSGWRGEMPTIWRSNGHVSADHAWEEITLPYRGLPGAEIAIDESDLETEVNAEGEIVVSVATHFEITGLLLGLSGDPTATSLLHLDERPRVAASQQRLWMTTTVDGEEVTHLVDLPTTAVFDPDSGAYGTGTGLAVARSLWVSPDGQTFDRVDLSGLPVGPRPRALGEFFVSAAPGNDGGQTLWVSESGVDWEPTTTPPPSECSAWQQLAVGSPGLLLTNERFDSLCLSADGSTWTVAQSPSTALSSSGRAWVDGGDSGFVALVNSAQEFAVLVSSNGLDWQRIDFGPGTVGSHTLQVGNQLVASVMVVEKDPPGRRFDLRVGTPTAP